MRLPRRFLLLAALLAVAPAAPAHAIGDLRAQDASDLFIAMCLGHPDGGAFAKQAFDTNPGAGRPLGPKELVAAFGGTLGAGVGWVLGTPSGGEVILGYTPALNSCSMLVRGAEAESMRDALLKGIAAFVGPRTGARATPRPEATTMVDGISVTTIGWDIAGVEGHDWSLIAALGAEPTESRQHVLSLTLTE